MFAMNGSLVHFGQTGLIALVQDSVVSLVALSTFCEVFICISNHGVIIKLYRQTMSTYSRWLKKKRERWRDGERGRVCGE